MDGKRLLSLIQGMFLSFAIALPAAANQYNLLKRAEDFHKLEDPIRPLFSSDRF